MPVNLKNADTLIIHPASLNEIRDIGDGGICDIYNGVNIIAYDWVPKDTVYLVDTGGLRKMEKHLFVVDDEQFLVIPLARLKGRNFRERYYAIELLAFYPIPFDTMSNLLSVFYEELEANHGL